MKLQAVIVRIALPDPSYFFESVTLGMKVTLCVKEMRGRAEITREIFSINKGQPHWQRHMQLFKDLAVAKYSKPVNSLANLYKSGS